MLGIELGSTRIKAVLLVLDERFTPIAQGDSSWENRLENGVWTYDLSEVWKGLRADYAALEGNVVRAMGEPIARGALACRP